MSRAPRPLKPGRFALVAALASGLIFLAAKASAEGPAGTGRISSISIETADGPRRALVVPSAHGAAPALILLHGALGTPEMMLRSSGFREAAEAAGFTLVIPEGINRQWNDGREGGKAHAADDVAFLKALVADIGKRGLAAPGRLFIAGVSNGGMMTFRLLCEEPRLFAGAATVIANMPGGIGEHCKPGVPVPLVMINGTADPMVPYAGGGVGPAGGRGIVWSTEATARFFAEANGCRPQPAGTPTAEPSGDIRVEKIAWNGCRNGAGVTLYRIVGGGHQLPGKQAFLPRLLGRSTDLLQAPETILRTFSSETKEPGGRL